MPSSAGAPADRSRKADFAHAGNSELRFFLGARTVEFVPSPSQRTYQYQYTLNDESRFAEAFARPVISTDRPAAH